MANQQPGSFIQTFPLPSRPMTTAKVSSQEMVGSNGQTSNPYQSLVNTFGRQADEQDGRQSTSSAQAKPTSSVEEPSSQAESSSEPTTVRQPVLTAQSLCVNVLQSVQNIDQYGPVALCHIGRDLTREIINRTTDIATFMRTVQPPVAAETARQQQDKVTRGQETMKQVVFLLGRLEAIIAKVQEMKKTMLPPDSESNIESLIPWSDQPDGAFYTIRDEALAKEDYAIAYEQYQSIRHQLEEQNEILRKNIEFFRQCTWDISSMNE